MKTNFNKLFSVSTMTLSIALISTSDCTRSGVPPLGASGYDSNGFDTNGFHNDSKIAYNPADRPGDDSRGFDANGGLQNFSTHIIDPCQIRDLTVLTSPEIGRIFSNDPTQYANFHNSYNHTNASRELTIKSWLMATDTFSGTQPNFVTLDRLSGGIGHRNNGGANEGIYDVRITQAPERRFILKVGFSENEAKHMWKLQNSIVGHPECFLRTDLGLRATATQTEVDHFPKLPKVYEAAYFRIDPNDGRSSGRYFILMDLASGHPLASFDRDQLATLDIYRNIGKSLGYFHYFHALNVNPSFNSWTTMRHDDLNTNNVFFDQNTNQMTFVDIGNIDRRKMEDVNYDVHQLAYQGVKDTLEAENSGYRQYFHDLLNAVEVQQQALRGANVRFYTGFLDNGYILQAHELSYHDEIITAIRGLTGNHIQHLQAFLDLDKVFKFYKVVVQGYVEAFPEDRRASVRRYFGTFCRDSATKVMRNWSNYEHRPIEKDLEDAFVSTLPHDFQNCMNDIFI